MNIENSQLKIVLFVYKEGNFSSAAKRLKITQSAVSQSIKNIEAKLDLKLFKRAGNKMVVTQEGMCIVKFAIKQMTELDNLLLSMSKSKDEVFGDVTIGTFFGLGKSWVSNLCIDLSKQYKDLSLTLEMSLLSPLIQGFNDSDLDLLILPEEVINFPYENKITIGNESLVLVYPKKKSFRVNPNMTLDELSVLPTILFERNNDDLFNKWCKSVYKKYPKFINKKLVVNSHGNILQAVSEGLGIAVVPYHVLERSFYKTKVNTLSDKIIHSGKISLIYKTEDLRLKRVNVVVNAIKDHYQKTKDF